MTLSTWKVIVTVVIAVVCAIVAPYLLGLWGTFWGAVVGGAAGGFAGGFAGTLLNGGTLKQAFMAGLEGAAWGAVAGAAGGYINGLEFAKWETFCKSMAYGVSGSAISYAQGGSIESGFLAGFAGGLAGGAFNSLPGKVFAGAIVGGCASMVGGGKFESGAVAGAFASLVGALLESSQEQEQALEAEFDGLGTPMKGSDAQYYKKEGLATLNGLSDATHGEMRNSLNMTLSDYHERGQVIYTRDGSLEMRSGVQVGDVPCYGGGKKWYNISEDAGAYPTTKTTGWLKKITFRATLSYHTHPDVYSAQPPSLTDCRGDLSSFILSKNTIYYKPASKGQYVPLGPTTSLLR